MLRALKNTTRRLFRGRKVAPGPDEREYKAAGCVFTDGGLILGGYQPYKKQPFISGIGGAREGGENYLETALRETVEELFDIRESDIPSNLISALVEHFIPRKVIQNGSYVMLVYNFKDLDKFLGICKSYKVVSPLYAKFPTTLDSLLFTRSSRKGSPEISQLAILPVVPDHDPENPVVDARFISDMAMF